MPGPDPGPPPQFIVRSLITFIYAIVYKEDSILKITYSRAPDWMIPGFLQGTIVLQGGG